jgi:membrane protease YdiL (CAAX protease family)
MWTRTILMVAALLAWKPVTTAARPLGANESTLIGYAWVATVVLVRSWWGGIPLAELIGPARAGDVARGVTVGSLLFVVGVFGYAATQSLTGAQLSAEATAFFDVSSVRAVLLVVTITVLAVFAEEAAFRGILLRDLSTQLPTPFAITISAVLFAAFHVSVLQAASTFVLGVGLAWLALSRGSLVPALAAHATYNLLGIGLALLARR